MTDNKDALSALGEMPHWEKVSPHMSAPTANFGNWAIKHEAAIRAALTTSPSAGVDVSRIRDAIWQILDDGNYTNADGDIVIDGQRTTGGGYCHAAALKLIEAYMSLPSPPQPAKDKTK